MPIEAKISKEINPSEIEGHDFRIPTITRGYDAYKINNLHLLPDWDTNVSSLKRVDIQYYCNHFNDANNDRINGQVLYDQNTNLITEVSFEIPKTQSSRVSLDQGFASRSGTYRGENITTLPTAILYQDFLSRYLSHISNPKNNYAYISHASREYCSIDLNVPKSFKISEKEIFSNKYYQEEIFPLKASYISGQFSTRLNYIQFNNDGLINIVQVDQNDCHYCLSKMGFERGYYPHNVDSPFQAATLHGIVAEHLNDFLVRKNNENK